MYIRRKILLKRRIYSNRMINLAAVNNAGSNNISLQPTLLRFIVKNNTPIDYFQLDPAIIGMDKFEVETVPIQLQAGEHINIGQHLAPIDHYKTETVVFNLSVGTGKTTACYQLAQQYKQAGYYVIICSANTALAQKDHQELSKLVDAKDISSFRHIQVGESADLFSHQPIEPGIQAAIQIMTINCLLQNPGEDIFEQAFHHSNYLDNLLQTITQHNKKVVFIFDEIHESVPHFKNELLPYLMKWRHVTHKCYVATATHSPASIPVIRYIAYLTDKKIKIFDNPRVKNNTQASLHLHISTEQYNSKRLFPLNRIATLIQSYNSRKINILVGHKALAKALTNERNQQNRLIGKILGLQPNNCTDETENIFNEQEHNIGTNFKSGINIEDRRSVLIIVLPIVTSNKNDHYGIFNDGAGAIIQAIGRIRKGGEIHIFLYAPETIIALEQELENLDDKLYEGKSGIAAMKLNEAYEKVKHTYEAEAAKLDPQITFLNQLAHDTPALKYHYPTFQEYLLDKSQDLIMDNYEPLGKGLSAYVLWASINNQFANATLRTIELISKNFQHIELQPDNIYQTLFHLLTEEQRTELAQQSFKTAFENVTAHIQKSKRIIARERNEIEEAIYTNRFFYEGKSINISALRKIAPFNLAIISIIYFLKQGTLKEISKEEYLNTCIANIDQATGEEPELTDAYTRFRDVKEQFLQYFEENMVTNRGNEKIIHQGYYTNLPDHFILETIEVINLLKRTDAYLNCPYSFFQDKKQQLNSENITEAKRIIATELERNFTTIKRISENKRTHNGEVKKYYLITEPIVKDYQLENIAFL
jgi:hypothetical protein